MDEMEKNNKKFVSDGSLEQNVVDGIVRYLEDCGMSDDDIEKAGMYKGWFHKNPQFNMVKSELKGKGKK